MNTQLTIDFDPRQRGEADGYRCMAKAQKTNPEFSEKAEKAILEYLHTHGQASGEDLTDHAVKAGAICHDMRAFGPVFAGLARRGLIRTVGFCLRKRGNGTAGGRIWGVCL